jgi:Dolichyl-phosphate-mannose-protein mannosyltransferase
MPNAALPSASRVNKRPLVLITILCAAALPRLICLGSWSLWLDEETAIYHALNVNAAFPRCCPVYFRLLNGLFAVNHEYILVGRVTSVAFGVLGVWLTYELCRRHASEAAGIVAALLLAVNLYHLFWSQSVRYYTMLFAAEMAASLFFVEGIVNRNRRQLLLAGIVAFASVWIHYTAVFLLPVLIGYLILIRLLGHTDNATTIWAIVGSIMPMVLATALALPQIRGLQVSGATGPLIASQHPIPLLARIAFYYGCPVLLLALAGMALTYRSLAPGPIFLALLAAIPILELCVVGMLGLANVTIHHAFVSLAGCVGLAAIAIATIFQQRMLRLGVLVVVVTAGYSFVMLWLYFTTMHGDRPRWDEAVALVRPFVNVEAAHATPVFATAPGVVSYYLGVPADQTMRSSLVTNLPALSDGIEPTDSWFVVDAFRASESWMDWLNRNTERVGSFEAWTGPRDRTVTVYRAGGRVTVTKPL